MFRPRFELCNFGVQIIWASAWANLDHVWSELAEYIMDKVTDPTSKRERERWRISNSSVVTSRFRVAGFPNLEIPQYCGFLGKLEHISCFSPYLNIIRAEEHLIFVHAIRTKLSMDSYFLVLRLTMQPALALNKETCTAIFLYSTLTTKWICNLLRKNKNTKGLPA
jgi:hypothetical protein